MPPINIFLTGATGYIGGSVLAALLSHPRTKGFEITVLIRTAAKVSGFASVGVKPVVGTNADIPLLTKLAAQSDVVVACADADDLDAARAMLAGLQYRYRQTGSPSILIHTSGAGVLDDDAKGNFASNEIYSDLDIAKMESLPRTQPHRDVDLAIVAAGYVRTHIVLPGLVYGIAETPLVSLGLQNPRSQQIPKLIEAGTERHQGGVVGKGLNIWSNVHIDDLASLYICIFETALDNPQLQHGREGLYFGASDEESMGVIARVVAEELHAEGLGRDAAPTVFTEAEVAKYFGGPFMGNNARARGERGRTIGWKPLYTTEDMLDSIEGEIKASGVWLI
ncbi:hypothetical protein F5I97DRAFT_1469634 [Phlebopus sp. FC_14]|nr:hypothetical protein F5I97DRAFT_1469634 [Phlebopus sp. FC_14]